MNTKKEMNQKYAMKLTEREQEILEGKHGKVLQKAMESVVVYGKIFNADKLVPLDGAGHLVTSFGARVIRPYFSMVDEIINAGLRPEKPFTVDPRPIDFKNLRCTGLEKLLFNFIYGKQKAYEKQLVRLGLRDTNAFTCTCYLPEVGNTPKKGDVLAWSESSAVVYANSVLGARTNRNSAGIDLLCNLLGRVPLYGLLVDKGRRATWSVKVKTSTLPNAQLLGSAIGMRVVEDVPFVTGIDTFLGKGLNGATVSYLKDMGAAAASNGAVGLYHVEKITPEAQEMGRKLLVQDCKTYVIDDRELEKVMHSYPVLWKKKDTKPKLCLIGCPHLSLDQLRWWARHIPAGLQKDGQAKVKVETVLFAAPDVVKRFKENGEEYAQLEATGVKISSICPLMYMNNPLVAKKPVATNSNKLRTYSTARFFLDEDVLRIIAKNE